jgi:hypothetical protein
LIEKLIKNKKKVKQKIKSDSKMDVLKINVKEVVLNTNLTIKELKEICVYCEIKYYGNKISVITRIKATRLYNELKANVRVADGNLDLSKNIKTNYFNELLRFKKKKETILVKVTLNTSIEKKRKITVVVIMKR